MFVQHAGSPKVLISSIVTMMHMVYATLPHCHTATRCTCNQTMIELGTGVIRNITILDPYYHNNAFWLVFAYFSCCNFYGGKHLNELCAYLSIKFQVVKPPRYDYCGLSISW